MSRKAFIFGLIVAGLLVIGLYRAKDGARESGAEIVRLEAEIAEAYRQKALLEADLAHMSRREWVEEYARRELGMAPARANQFATEYNLDLLVGRPQARASVELSPQGDSAPGDSAQNNIVSVPVIDASNSEAKEGADQE
jgi:hypothetical protein